MTAASGDQTSPTPFPVVGIGGSAGSLEPLQTFLDSLPPRPGAAFVVVTHHPAGQRNLLPGLLADRTALPVTVAEPDSTLEPDHVYVIPSDGTWGLRGTRLVCQEPGTENGEATREETSRRFRPPHPVDTFFRSLAGEIGHRAVGIVLSGTGTDGTLGVKAIKSQAGMVMAQDPDTTEFDGMPASAIGTNLVDYVLPPGDMPATLTGYIRAQADRQAPPRSALPAISEATLEAILRLMAERTGHDFSGYKRSTLLRRLERRMNVHRIGDADEYLRYLRDNPAEGDLLFREVIISVTNFFRDPDAWAILAGDILAELLQTAASEQRGFRAWVVGCATGEEAYTLAILLQEWLDTLETAPEVQIFATDVDQEAIETARVGRYPAGIADDLTPARLARHFVAEEDSFRVGRNLRDMVVFADHNALQDPPFTRLDLICCRNLLIYLERDLQAQLLPLFRYALQPRGVLFLGPSEAPDQLTEDFRPENRAWRIYRLEAGAKPLMLPDMPKRRRARGPAAFHIPPSAPRNPAPGGFTQNVEHLLASRFAPPAVLVNDRGEAVFFHGRTGRFLEPAAGPANHPILEMARPGLRGPLGQALREVASEGHTVNRWVQVQTNGSTETIHLEVQRVDTPPTLRGLRLVAFWPPGPEGVEAVGTPKETAAESAPEEPESEAVARLRRELASTRQDQQVTVEEFQGSNEELQSLNEELQSMNEELQSSNEELEVAKEEVDSLNEELRSVNAELEARVGELSEANDDLKNLLDATDIATLFLDEDLAIKRFTDSARDLIALRETDVGRPIDELSTNLRYSGLRVDGKEVLDTLRPKEVEVQTEAGHWYLLRIMPYRTTQNVIRGLVCTFQNIQAAKRLEYSESFFRAIVETVREPLLVLDPDLRVVSANDGFYQAFPLKPEAVEGQRLFDLADGQWDHPELRTRLEEVLPQRQGFRDFDLPTDFGPQGPRRLLLNARKLEQEAAGEAMILLTMGVVGAGEGQCDGG